MPYHNNKLGYTIFTTTFKLTLFMAHICIAAIHSFPYCDQAHLQCGIMSGKRTVAKACSIVTLPYILRDSVDSLLPTFILILSTFRMKTPTKEDENESSCRSFFGCTLIFRDLKNSSVIHETTTQEKS